MDKSDIFGKDNGTACSAEGGFMATSMQDIRAFVDGVRQFMVQGEPKPDEPLEQLLTEVLGRRTVIQTRLPGGEEMWSEYVESVPGREGNRLQTAYRCYKTEFPRFARKTYGSCLHEPWTDASRAVVLGVMKQSAPDFDSWEYLTLRFGVTNGKPQSFTDIGKTHQRNPGMIQMQASLAIAALRSAPMSDVVRMLSARKQREN